MAEKAGIGARMSAVTETTYGTFKVPTQGVRFLKEGIKRGNQYMKNPSLGAGELGQTDSTHTQTTRDAAGPLEGEFLGGGMGWLLNMLHGETVVPAVLAAGVAFGQTHPIGLTSPNGKSVAVQVGRPDVGGTMRVFHYLGGKVAVLKLSLAVGGTLQFSADLDFQEEDKTRALATPTFDANARALSFQQSSIEFDDVIFMDCVQSVDVTITIPLKTDRYCISASALKKEQLLNDRVSVALGMNMEFASMAQCDAFSSGARRKVELLCEGPVLSGAFKQSLGLTVPKAVTTDVGPVIEGNDLVTQNITLEAVQTPGVPLATLVYQSADAAIA